VSIDVATALPPETNATAQAWPLQLTCLTKRWRRDLPAVLDGLDLSLAPATCTWVGGRNGAGKTTMLRIAAGLIEPDSGSAEVQGLDAREQRVRYQTLVSFLPAGDRGLYARLTVRRQLRFWGRISLIPAGRFEAAVREMIDAFALGDLVDRRVDRMSMGQRQRLRLAMTFLVDPDVVLLDEPLTSLDGEGSLMLAAAIGHVLDRDGAVLWCSPEPDGEGFAFDSRWQLQDGRLVSV
jgi:ABC-type multidrug transport system ATPase subunit